MELPVATTGQQQRVTSPPPCRPATPVPAGRTGRSGSVSVGRASGSAGRARGVDHAGGWQDGMGQPRTVAGQHPGRRAAAVHAGHVETAAGALGRGRRQAMVVAFRIVVGVQCLTAPALRDPPAVACPTAQPRGVGRAPPGAGRVAVGRRAGPLASV